MPPSIRPAPSNGVGEVFIRWLLLRILGRHVADIDDVENILPQLGVGTVGDLRFECVQSHVAILLLCVVAFEALVLQENYDRRIDVEPWARCG